MRFPSSSNFRRVGSEQRPLRNLYRSDHLGALDDKLAFVCAPEHPLASKSKVSLAALSDQPFIAFDREAPTRKAIDKILKTNGIEVHKVAEFDNIETIKRAMSGK